MCTEEKLPPITPCFALATLPVFQELLDKCHPLGVFDSIATLAVAQNMRELYRLVLVDTPLAPYFSENLTHEDLDEMNIEVGLKTGFSMSCLLICMQSRFQAVSAVVVDKHVPYFMSGLLVSAHCYSHCIHAHAVSLFLKH